MKNELMVLYYVLCVTFQGFSIINTTRWYWPTRELYYISRDLCQPLVWYTFSETGNAFDIFIYVRVRTWLSWQCGEKKVNSLVGFNQRLLGSVALGLDSNMRRKIHVLDSNQKSPAKVTIFEIACEHRRLCVLYLLQWLMSFDKEQARTARRQRDKRWFPQEWRV